MIDDYPDEETCFIGFFMVNILYQGQGIGSEIIESVLVYVKKIGKAKVKVNVNGNGEAADQEIELEVRSPNPPITRTTGNEVTSVNAFNASYQPFGIEGTNLIQLQLSSLPEMRLGERLDYLIGYPHGCIEQTTSKAFVQLYLDDLMELSDAQRSDVQRNVKVALNKLKTHQLSGGGLAYWSGASRADDWGTSYALHFVLKAEKKGYQTSFERLIYSVTLKKNNKEPFQCLQIQCVTFLKAP